MRIEEYPFGKIYEAYLNKLARKGRDEAELLAVITWMTGYSPGKVGALRSSETTMAQFFAGAPALNPACERVTGRICGVLIEELEDPLMKQIRQLDKLVDDLAKGRSLERVLAR